MTALMTDPKKIKKKTFGIIYVHAIYGYREQKLTMSRYACNSFISLIYSWSSVKVPWPQAFLSDPALSS